YAARHPQLASTANALSRALRLDRAGAPGHSRAMSRKKTVLLLAAGFGLGAVAGVVGSVLFFYKTELVRGDLARAFHLDSAAEPAVRQVHFGSPEVAMHAMEHLVEVLKTYQGNELSLDPKTAQQLLQIDLGLNYARLGKVAEKTSDKAKAQQAFAQGLIA